MSSSSSPPTTSTEGGHDIGKTIIAITWSLIALTMVAVGARLFGRVVLTRNVGYDDFWIIISLVVNLLYTALNTVSVVAAVRRHTHELSLAQTTRALKYKSLANPCGIMSTTIPKLAVACLLGRLLNPKGINRLQKRIWFSLSISCNLAAVLCAIFSFIRCTPVASLWDQQVKSTCWNINTYVDFAIFTSALAAFTDFYLAVYPMTVLFKLNMTMKKKIGCSSALGLGVIATAVAIYRTSLLPDVRQHLEITYSSSDLAMMTSVESAVIIVAACIPTLRPVYLFITGNRNMINNNPMPMNIRGEYPLRSRSISSRTVLCTDLSSTELPMDAEADIMEDHILPPHAIVMTYDVEVTRNETRQPAAELPRDALELKAGQ